MAAQKCRFESFLVSFKVGVVSPRKNNEFYSSN